VGLAQNGILTKFVCVLVESGAETYDCAGKFLSPDKKLSMPETLPIFIIIYAKLNVEVD
jgi:hypothetical protein